ncbi:hypothetical protein M0805_004983 [Coniferiporia weirii]|nr:hypothetical protein M0805_004983 [Coniferiporia weirii]
MSADNPDTENTQPPAFNALRSKFEKLAQGTPPPPARLTLSTPTLPPRQDNTDLLSPASPASGRQRTLSNGHLDADAPSMHSLRPSSSSSDLKLARRPPPPPPPAPRSPKPFISPVLQPTPAPAPIPAINGLDRPALNTRKPPPPPVESPEPEVPPAGAVASLRSKFAGVSTPSLPSTRQQPSGNRVASHSSAMSSLRSLQTSESHHQQRHSISVLSDNSPLIRFEDVEQAAPPLPSRPPSNPLGSRSPPSDSGSPIVNPERIQRPPPSPPRRPVIRPPPRHTSLPLSALDPASSSPSSENGGSANGSSSTPTLQVPPPLPARRSPPIAVKDLPGQGRSLVRTDSPREMEPHQGAQSAPPALERKAKGSGQFAPPPVRTIGLGDKLPPPRRPPSNEGSGSESGDEEDPGQKTGRLTELLPDASNSSRRLPIPSIFAHARIPVVAHSGIICVAGPRVIVAHHHVKVFDLLVSDSPLHNIDLKEAGYGSDWRGKEPRVTSMAFRPADDDADRGRFVWIGTKDGTIWELDAQGGSVTAVRSAAHGAPVTHLLRHSRSMFSLDDQGKVLVFTADPSGCATMLLQGSTRVVRIAEKQGFAKMIDGRLWTSGGPGTGSVDGTVQAGGAVRGPSVRVYDVLPTGHPSTPRSLYPLEHIGAVTAGTVLPAHPDKAFLGHEGGFVTIWDLRGEDGAPVCIEVVKVSASDVLCMEGVGTRLWAGNRKGVISAYDVEQRPWVVTNSWQAHAGLPVQKLFIDPYSAEKCAQLLVVSVGRDEQARFWDGLLGVDWIDNGLLKRESSFSSFRPLKVLVVSWNVDAAKPDALNGCVENTYLLEDVLHSVDAPDIIVFGFQELIDLESRKMAAKTVLLGSKKKAPDGSISEKVSRSYRMWHDHLVRAVRLAMPTDCPYTAVHTDNLVGLFTCIFIKSSERKDLKDVAITTVKRGIGGMYGNKGGIVSRLVVDDSSICFINCHLAAGQRHVRARNADIAALLEEKEVFPPSGSSVESVAYVGGGDGSMVLDHEIVFLNGDLNYRIDQRRDATISAVATGQLDTLLVHDQLLKEMRHNPGFRLRTFIEAPIAFAPTYKYDRRSAQYDTGEKRRSPAWCDRVLYRTRDPGRVHCLHYRRYEANVSDHRPISAAFEVTVKAVDHAARALVKAEVEQLWEVERVVLLSEAHAFFELQEVV